MFYALYNFFVQCALVVVKIRSKYFDLFLPHTENKMKISAKPTRVAWSILSSGIYTFFCLLWKHNCRNYIKAAPLTIAAKCLIYVTGVLQGCVVSIYWKPAKMLTMEKELRADHPELLLTPALVELAIDWNEWLLKFTRSRVVLGPVKPIRLSQKLCLNNRSVQCFPLASGAETAASWLDDNKWSGFVCPGRCEGQKLLLNSWHVKLVEGISNIKWWWW